MARSARPCRPYRGPLDRRQSGRLGRCRSRPAPDDPAGKHADNQQESGKWVLSVSLPAASRPSSWRRRYIIEAMSAGLALFDYNSDGLVDIYFLNGAPLLGTQVDVAPRDALYRNEGGWKFTDVTEEAGVGDTGFGLGVTVGDYDGDGDPDLYLNNSGPNVLYRNNGDGTFTDVTAQAGVGNGSLVGAGACFFDMDADGDLDLYVGNYIDFRYDLHVQRTFNGFRSEERRVGKECRS